jgi:hypothetical protein
MHAMEPKGAARRSAPAFIFTSQTARASPVLAVALQLALRPFRARLCAFALSHLCRHEGAERRETLVRNAAPLACHDAARQGHLARHPAPSNAGRSPRDAPLRRLVDHGPDARLLWHHSLRIAAQARGHSAPGRDSVVRPSARCSNPARRRRSWLRLQVQVLWKTPLGEPGCLRLFLLLRTSQEQKSFGNRENANRQTRPRSRLTPKAAIRRSRGRDQAARTVVRNFSTSSLRWLLSPDSDCAAAST